MTAQWWSNFIEATDNMQEPFVFPNAMEEHTANLDTLLLEVLSTLFSEDQSNGNVRIWCNGAYDQEELYHSSLAEQNLTQWFQRVFKKEKFGIFINGCNHLSSSINERLATMMLPLLRNKGVPMDGLNVTLLIGNYGYTPFGVHIDQGPNEKTERNVFHFHLGPGEKTIYTWEPELYCKLAGGDPHYREREPERILKYAKKFTFNRGDVFFLPWSKYHVGYTEEISIGLTVIYPNDTNVAMVKKVLKRIEDEMLQEEYTEILSPLSDEGSLLEMGVDRQIKKAVNLPGGSLSAVFYEHYEDYKLEILSSMGFGADRSVESCLSEEMNTETLPMYGVVTGISPFTIYYKISTQSSERYIDIFARGQKFTMPYHRTVVEVIDKLNTWSPFSMEELIALLQSSFQVSEVSGLLMFLSKVRAIKIDQQVQQTLSI